ncbi:hypothetical protein PFISCL1PPCAC_7860, partial [Pristionchus fissidentatus]
EKNEEEVEERKQYPPGPLFIKINMEQRLFDKILSREEKALVRWLQRELEGKTLKHIKPPGSTLVVHWYQAGTNATKSDKTEDETKRASQSFNGTVSNAETASKVGQKSFATLSEQYQSSTAPTDDSFFTALLQEPTVI